jgi:chromosome segregation ATPase
VRRDATPAKSTPTPAGFPKVDADTQKSRDETRRKVLSEELAAEEKLLAAARATYANGAPVPLAEEQANAEKYRERIARLRQSVALHERNIEALRKELGSTR